MIIKNYINYTDGHGFEVYFDVSSLKAGAMMPFNQMHINKAQLQTRTYRKFSEIEMKV